MAAKKQTNREQISVVSTKITLNIKGKKIDLSLPELRILNARIMDVLNGYTSASVYSGHSISIPFSSISGCNVATDSSLTLSNAELDTKVGDN